ncbi:hypothetical protein PZ938_16585 [Luteipulveratus sp. YIM 133132]|uniref:hypothetical protein n=1 Tax=Luteipulveratus flavus TaxID=3031728 RepID=UPI0023B14CCE|nr:hypothetical protein [Luteipulveratus sp. YIM 133132]MDE9367238.1 hypothetical protein [Luteipulveratus sp. YIM 133132]
MKIASTVTTDGLVFTSLSDPLPARESWYALSGAIILEAGGVVILDEVAWDEIGLLWTALGEALTELMACDFVRMGFPGQDLDMDFERAQQNVIKIDVHLTSPRQATITEAELYESLGRGGVEFWQRMLQEYPQDAERVEWEIERSRGFMHRGHS